MILTLVSTGFFNPLVTGPTNVSRLSRLVGDQGTHHLREILKLFFLILLVLDDYGGRESPPLILVFGGFSVGVWRLDYAVGCEV